jgi:hypothetical protein
MSDFGKTEEIDNSEMTILPSRTWPNYVNLLSGLVEEAKRVIKGGGLQEPSIAKHLMNSRDSEANYLSNGIDK